MTSQYTITTAGTVLILLDRDQGKSITNGAEAVVEELYGIFGNDLASKRIIYRDTTGRYDGLAHRQGKFLAFVVIDSFDQEEAVERARSHEDWPV